MGNDGPERTTQQAGVDRVGCRGDADLGRDPEVVRRAPAECPACADQLKSPPRTGFSRMKDQWQVTDTYGQAEEDLHDQKKSAFSHWTTDMSLAIGPKCSGVAQR